MDGRRREERLTDSLSLSLAFASLTPFASFALEGKQDRVHRSSATLGRRSPIAFDDGHQQSQTPQTI